MSKKHTLIIITVCSTLISLATIMINFKFGGEDYFKDLVLFQTSISICASIIERPAYTLTLKNFSNCMVLGLRQSIDGFLNHSMLIMLFLYFLLEYFHIGNEIKSITLICIANFSYGVAIGYMRSRKLMVLSHLLLTLIRPLFMLITLCVYFLTSERAVNDFSQVCIFILFSQLAPMLYLKFFIYKNKNKNKGRVSFFNILRLRYDMCDYFRLSMIYTLANSVMNYLMLVAPSLVDAKTLLYLKLIERSALPYRMLLSSAGSYFSKKMVTGISYQHYQNKMKTFRRLGAILCFFNFIVLFYGYYIGINNDLILTSVLSIIAYYYNLYIGPVGTHLNLNGFSKSVLIYQVFVSIVSILLISLVTYYNSRFSAGYLIVISSMSVLVMNKLYVLEIRKKGLFNDY